MSAWKEITNWDAVPHDARVGRYLTDGSWQDVGKNYLRGQTGCTHFLDASPPPKPEAPKFIVGPCKVRNGKDGEVFKIDDTRIYGRYEKSGCEWHLDGGFMIIDRTQSVLDLMPNNPAHPEYVK